MTEQDMIAATRQSSSGARFLKCALQHLEFQNICAFKTPPCVLKRRPAALTHFRPRLSAAPLPPLRPWLRPTRREVS